VPGITAACGAAAWNGLPLTDRRLASTVAFVTAEEDPAHASGRVNWAALAGIDTVVLYMGVKTLDGVAARLIAAGKAADTPAAIIERATLPGQRVISATLKTIAQAAAAADIQPPAITIVGPVVSLAAQLDWRSALPLAGRTIVITRPADQSMRLRDQLSDLGADVLTAPAVEVRPAEDLAAVDAALRQIDQYAWICFTSAHGVAAFLQRAVSLGLDGRAFGGVKIAAIGPATAEALGRHFLRPDLLPHRYTGQDLAEEILARDGAPGGGRVLLARSDLAQPELPAALRQAGVVVDDVVVYRSVCPASLPVDVVAALAAGKVNWVTFTSGSTVRNFLALARRQEVALDGVKLASIGPSTSAALREAGLEVHVQAQPHTAEGLCAALLAAEGISP
jgi:uroporphyrinogen III methyltransferase/synthase